MRRCNQKLTNIGEITSRITLCFAREDPQLLLKKATTSGILSVHSLLLNNNHESFAIETAETTKRRKKKHLTDWSCSKFRLDEDYIMELQSISPRSKQAVTNPNARFTSFLLNCLALVSHLNRNEDGRSLSTVYIPAAK